MGNSLARSIRSEVISTQPSLPVLGSTASDAISLGRVFHPGQGVANKLQYGGPLSVMVFGPNGKGKSTGLLVPNLLRMSGSSLVVVDPKGELAAITAEYRRTLGPVVIINPFGVLTNIPGYGDLKSAGFNPLARLDPDSKSFNADAGLLADALWPVTNPKDPHWEESAQTLGAALIMYAVIKARELRRVPSFDYVRELLCLPSSPRKGNQPPTGIPDLAEKMIGYGIAGLANKAGQFVNWTDEKDGIASTAMRQSERFDDPQIADDLAKDGIDFREIKRRPTTVYIILPPDMVARHSKWLRLVLSAAIRDVLRFQERGEPKTVFMMDEFFALGHLEIISTVWSLVRGYGIQMMPILQDLGQLKKLYPDMWETMIGMCGATASFGPNEMTTADWLSRRSGDMTQILMSYNQGGGMSSSPNGTSYSDNSGLNYSAVKVPRITAHQLLGLPNNFMQVTLSGLPNVITAYAPPYFDITQCRDRARSNPYHMSAR